MLFSIDSHSSMVFHSWLRVGERLFPTLSNRYQTGPRFREVALVLLSLLSQ